MALNKTCPCCLEDINGITIHPFNNNDLQEMHINGLFISQWKIVKYNETIIYILTIDNNKVLPFNSLQSISDQFKKPIGFYQEYFETLTPINITMPYNFVGKCNHAICFECYNQLTENKCPNCRQINFLCPAPIKTTQIGYIIWQQNYLDFTPIINETSYDNYDIDSDNYVHDDLPDIVSNTYGNYEDISGNLNDTDNIMNENDIFDNIENNYEDISGNGTETEMDGTEPFNQSENEINNITSRICIPYHPDDEENLINCRELINIILRNPPITYNDEFLNRIRQLSNYCNNLTTRNQNNIIINE